MLLFLFGIVDPVRGNAYILGDANSTKIVTLKQSAQIRCLAGGHPKPYVSWWRGTELLPLKSTRFEVTRDYSLTFNDIDLSDLGPYICQAYSGEGRPVSMYVTLKAVGPVHVANEDDKQYLKYLIDAPDAPTTPRYPYRPRPISPHTPDVPVIIEELGPSRKYWCLDLLNKLMFRTQSVVDD